MEPLQKQIKISSKGRKIMDLPNELLESIFLKLSHQDIQRNVALVCQRFLQITRKPKFVKTARVGLFQNPDRTSMDKINKCSLEKGQN